MNSAIGNFDSNGARMQSEQTPENTHSIDWYKSKLLSVEDEVKRLQHIIDAKVQLMPDGTLKPFYPTLAEDQHTVFTPIYRKFSVPQDEPIDPQAMQMFITLIYSMLTNGVTLFELQQRLMGF